MDSEQSYTVVQWIVDLRCLHLHCRGGYSFRVISRSVYIRHGIYPLIHIRLGTSIAFFGNTPPVFNDSQTLTVSIDGGTPYNTTYADPNPQSYRQWYQTPTLTDGQHTVLLSHVLGTALDYAVVTVGKDTPLGTNRIIVDNEDPLITYKGSWSRSIEEFDAGSLPDGFPYRNSTQRSSTPGDTFTFQFSGKLFVRDVIYN